MSRFIDPDIRAASTLPSEMYCDPELYRAQVEGIFARSWHFVSAAAAVEPSTVRPFTLLEGCLDEPMVLTGDASGARHCLSNVCTHRGNLVAVDAARSVNSLRCRYHGRRFGLDGSFAHMPEFEGARDFPSPSDDLPKVPHDAVGPLLFAGVRPTPTFSDWIGPVRDRLSFVPWERLVLAEERAYQLDAHWALYCDNYLEGFHIPFVHASLSDALDYGEYATETFPWGSFQIGIGKDDDEMLDLPSTHPDRGRRVAAYYAFLFPSTMINVYAWGVSINAVRPLGPGRTQVEFVTLVHDPSRRGRGVGADLHRVEMEDEAIVQRVQLGVRSRFYGRGRYSPTREVGVHHFHELIVRELSAFE